MPDPFYFESGVFPKLIFLGVGVAIRIRVERAVGCRLGFKPVGHFPSVRHGVAIRVERIRLRPDLVFQKIAKPVPVGGCERSPIEFHQCEESTFSRKKPAIFSKCVILCVLPFSGSSRNTRLVPPTAGSVWPWLLVGFLAVWLPSALALRPCSTYLRRHFHHTPPNTARRRIAPMIHGQGAGLVSSIVGGEDEATCS